MPLPLNTQLFIEKSRSIHGGFYDYSQTNYTNNLGKVEIVCPTHGVFSQRASNHMLGRGCPSCKSEKTSSRCVGSFADFIEKATSVHGQTYDYSRVIYSKSNSKVIIICAVHGEFMQTPNAHLVGSGCPKCAGKFRTTEDFIAQARAVHGDLYDYSDTRYELIKDAVTINCKIHGSFQQSAEGHLVGKGCKYCWYESYSSKGEKEIAAWIESLGVKVERNNRDALTKGLEIDIYIPLLRVGIEYNGCYWHSDKIERNKRKNEFKHLCANTGGVKLLTVWDYDWQHKKDIVKRIIAHALNLSTDTKINARSCDVTAISANEANALYSSNHIQGACRGGVIHLGLRHRGTIVAAMTFSQGSTRRGITASGEWELARYATSAIVRGGASRLFSAFLKQTGAHKVWSFSDKQHFSGGLYRQLGFIDDGALSADYRVVHPITLTTWHKSLWQRKSIPRRIVELNSKELFNPATDIRTEHQMQDAMKVLRVWDAGKTRWLWMK